MLTMWDVYWITRLDSINVFLLMLLISVAGFGCTYMFSRNPSTSNQRPGKDTEGSQA